MAHDRRVSFVTQQPARCNEDGKEDGAGLLVVRPQSVFNRLGPKVSMCDPPYVPESVGEPPLAGMIFGCTNETYAECMNRELFGLPIANKPQVCLLLPRLQVRIARSCSVLSRWSIVVGTRQLCSSRM